MPIHTPTTSDTDPTACRALLDSLNLATRGDRDNPVSASMIDTPIGRMIAIAGRAGLHMLEFTDGRGIRTSIARLSRRLDADIAPQGNPHLSETMRQVSEYFAGTRRVFDLPLAAIGTERQRRAWCYVSAIPFGETRSYSDMACALGNARAVRAAGSANGANPISIVVPCHRIVGANGSLTGYGGGLERKRWLLEHERQVNALRTAPQFANGIDSSESATPVTAEGDAGPRAARSRTRARP